jgi:hypothetical protein
VDGPRRPGARFTAASMVSATLPHAVCGLCSSAPCTEVKYVSLMRVLEVLANVIVRLGDLLGYEIIGTPNAPISGEHQKQGILKSTSLYHNIS